MKILLFIALFIINLQFVFSQQVEISVTTTGKICGEILELNINNPLSTEQYFILEPFYLPLPDNDQALLVTEGTALLLGPGQQMKIFLHGYTVFSDRSFPKQGIQFKLADIQRFIMRNKIDFSDSASLFGHYVPEKFTGSRLISLDFIPTKPGTFELTGYKIDLLNHPEIASIFLLNQAKLLSEGYEKLYTAGKVITHFNQDPRLEKDIMMQTAIWVCSAGLEGKALKYRKLAKLFRDIYVAVLKTLPEKDFMKHTDSYLRLLDRMGKEGKVFIRPEDLDRKPQCLPAVVGLSAISDNVRTPTLSTVRYKEYEVRNQAMLGPKNDCMPCILREDMKPALRNYLYQTEITKALGKYEFLRNQLDSVAWPVFVAQPMSYLDGLKNFNPRLWIAGSSKELNEELTLIYENARFYLDNIIKYTDIQQLSSVSSFLKEYQHDYLLLLMMTGDVYRLRESRYSFDCCELTRIPTQAYFQLSVELENFFKKYHLRLYPELPEYVPLVFDSQFFNQFILKGTLIYTSKALLSYFKILASDKQMICLDGPFPTERFSALEKINAFLGADLNNVGSFAYGRLMINLDENTSLEFRFGECNCGKRKESMLPFPALEPLKNHLFSESLKPLDIKTKFEVSGYYGRAYPAPQGASYFNGGGLTAFDHIPHVVDSFLRLKYGEKYWFSEPDSFRFDWFSVYRISAGYDISDHWQIRLSGEKSNGISLARAAFHYLTNPLDSNSEKVNSSGLYTKINGWAAGGEIRYYMGNYFKIFGGANLSYHHFSGGITKAYLENLEIEMNKTNGFSCFSAGIEVGGRYYFNQDFFIEFSSRVLQRFVNDGLNIRFNPDKQFLIGAGARF